jgi:mono/diheme cytochrome c family protein
MTRSAWMLLLPLAAWPQLAVAQQAGPTLNDKELQGRNLFAQHCIVCHVKIQLGPGGQYGPILSKASLGGMEDVMREFISGGTPNMPGFKYTFKPEQIDAIVAYLKTVPVPPPAGAPAAPAPAPH